VEKTMVGWRVLKHHKEKIVALSKATGITIEHIMEIMIDEFFKKDFGEIVINRLRTYEDNQTVNKLLGE
jgi:hypothetical protein